VKIEPLYQAARSVRWSIHDQRGAILTDIAPSKAAAMKAAKAAAELLRIPCYVSFKPGSANLSGSA
jgi:hypothetical protein